VAATAQAPAPVIVRRGPSRQRTGNDRQQHDHGPLRTEGVGNRRLQKWMPPRYLRDVFGMSFQRDPADRHAERVEGYTHVTTEALGKIGSPCATWSSGALCGFAHPNSELTHTTTVRMKRK
jgi:hypothetical protein